MHTSQYGFRLTLGKNHMRIPGVRDPATAALTDRPRGLAATLEATSSETIVCDALPIELLQGRAVPCARHNTAIARSSIPICHARAVSPDVCQPI